MEQRLKITEVTKGDKVYKNLTIKTRYKWDKGKKQFVFDNDGNKIVLEQGILPDNYVILEKLFSEGMEFDGAYGKSYSCGVLYNGEQCSFWLPEVLHKEYAACGGQGDKVKISCVVIEKLNKKIGVKVPSEYLTFERA